MWFLEQDRAVTNSTSFVTALSYELDFKELVEGRLNDRSRTWPRVSGSLCLASASGRLLTCMLLMQKETTNRRPSLFREHLHTRCLDSKKNRDNMSSIAGVFPIGVALISAISMSAH